MSDDKSDEKHVCDRCLQDGRSACRGRVEAYCEECGYSSCDAAGFTPMYAENCPSDWEYFCHDCRTVAIVEGWCTADADKFDNEALDAALPHTLNYWRAARSGNVPEFYDDPLPDAADPDEGEPYSHDEVCGYRWSVGNHDIRLASFQIATLLFGPDNGSVNRDDIECQIQKVLKTSFDHTRDEDAESAS